MAQKGGTKRMGSGDFAHMGDARVSGPRKRWATSPALGGLSVTSWVTVQQGSRLTDSDTETTWRSVATTR